MLIIFFNLLTISKKKKNKQNLIDNYKIHNYKEKRKNWFQNALMNIKQDFVLSDFKIFVSKISIWTGFSQHTPVNCKEFKYKFKWRFKTGYST